MSSCIYAKLVHIRVNKFLAINLGLKYDSAVVQYIAFFIQAVHCIYTCCYLPSINPYK